MRRLLLLLLLLFGSQTVTATSEIEKPFQPADTQLTPATAPALKAFEVSYKGKYNGFSIKTVRKLAQDANGDWIFSNVANAFLGSISEISHFSINADGLLMSAYRYDRSVLGKNRSLQIDFDHQSRQVRVTGEEEATLTLENDLLDKLSYQLLLRQALKDKTGKLDFRVVDKDRVKCYSFRLVGEENLTLAGGQLDTLVVERVRDNNKRKTTLWFAPSLDYLLVRLEQEEDGREYLLELEKLPN